MTQAFSSLLKAINLQDLSLSSSVLREALLDGSLVSLAEEMKQSIESTPSNSLAFRDHTAAFLDFWPVYFALKIPSYEILISASDTEDSVDAQMLILELVRSLIETQDKRISVHQIDTQTASKGHYSLLLPILLEIRAREFDTFTIPFFKDDLRSRYFVGYLSATSYGQDLLDTLGVPVNQLVIGENLWPSVENALTEIAITPSKRLIEVEEEEWVQLIKDFPDHKTSSHSKEIAQMDKLYSALRSLKSPNPDYRAEGLKTVLDSGSVTAIPMIAPLMREGPLFERYLVIEALSEVGGPEAESLLGDLLQDDDPVTRSKAARALAFFASKELSTPTDEFFKEPSLSETAGRIKTLAKDGVTESLDYLQVLSKHHNRYVKKEVISTLTAMNSEKGNCILRDMLRDKDESIRMDVVKSTKQIRNQDACDILKSAMQDRNSQVRALAEEIASNLWTEEFS